MSASLAKLEERVAKLEAAANPDVLSYAGTTRCANLIVAIAADLSHEDLGEIKGRGKKDALVTVRAAAAWVMYCHGNIRNLTVIGRVFGKDHSTVHSWKENHFGRDDVRALGNQILEAYRKGGAR